VGDPGSLDRPDLLDLEVADVLEQSRARPEQDGHDVQLELVDQPGGQVLLDDAGPPPTSTSWSPAARLAWARAASMPSVTKTKAAPLLDHWRAGVDLATLQALLPASGLELEHPLVQLHAADASALSSTPRLAGSFIAAT
jgi:hypothetical protein